jgi:hypothetical protein
MFKQKKICAKNCGESGLERDRVAYRAACREANTEINKSRAAFYTSRLREVSGDQRSTWRVVKELLHSKDRPPDYGVEDASTLCSGFAKFFVKKLEIIADTVRARLEGAPAYHRLATTRACPPRPDELAEVTAYEVVQLIHKLPSKSSPADCMPVSLLKLTADVMAPLIARLANLSFSSGVFPSALKIGRITPLLKKSGLDKTDMANYRPVTSLSTLSKLLEKLFLCRIRPHVIASGNFSDHQSAYRMGHSTETALLKVVNDAVMAACDKRATVLLSLDISAAFDTIDFNILLDRVSTDFGISGRAYSWLSSFITGRSQYVAVGKAKSAVFTNLSGVPQGSVLGPLLFAMYLSPVSNVVAAHSLNYHQYADDTQLYMAVKRIDGNSPTFGVVSDCADDVNRWFLENKMMLNPTKTEAILFGTRAHCEKVNTAGGITVAGATVQFNDTIKLLGVKLDSHLLLDRHVTDVVSSCCYHTRALRHIRPLLTMDAAKTIACSVVAGRLDYCNALLSGTSAGNIDRLQRAQNALARVVCQAPWSASATELRRSLHWLPIRQRVVYKLAVLTFRTRSTGVPSYLASFIADYAPLRHLRSSDQLLLREMKISLTMATKVFSVSAPKIWNSLSYDCRSAPSINAFKSRLKTELFDIVYNCTPVTAIRASDSPATYGALQVFYCIVLLYCEGNFLPPSDPMRVKSNFIKKFNGLKIFSQASSFETLDLELNFEHGVRPC